MPDQYAGIKKSIDEVTKAIGKLRDSEERSKRRLPVDIDLLTADEVDELRLLIAHESDLMSFSESRVKESGPQIRGMYQEFSRLGLCDQLVNGSMSFLSPMAHWAVEKCDQRARERREEQKSRRRHDYALAALTTLIGGLLAIVGSVIGAIL